MNIKRSKDGSIIEIDGKVRVEIGPVRRTEKATAELLSNNITADHYQAGRPDALNKKIEIGKPMDFIDWKSDARAWYVYQLAGTKKITMTEGPQKGSVVEKPDWQLRGTHDNEAAAISAAKSLASAPSKN